MDCGTSLVKYILFLFNTIVSIIGILSIAYGVILLDNIGMVKVGNQVGFPPQSALPIALITLGSIIAFIAFLGCCGAIRESVKMTMTYAILMLVLLIIQLLMIVMLWINKDKYDVAMGNVINAAWESNDSLVFEAIQKSLKCCGNTGITDYLAKFSQPPNTCCEHGDCLNPLNIYGGCRSAFVELMSGGSEHAKYFGLGLIGVEFVGFIFSCILANNVRNEKRRHDY